MLPLLLALLAAPAPELSAWERDPAGWVDILPGRNLSGWARIAPISTRKVVSVVNRDLPIWVVDRKTGILDCRGHLSPKGESNGSHEMLRHDQELGDFVFHVEWRFKDRERKGWNAGIYARVANPSIWHQAQVGNATGGAWFGDSPDASGKIVRQTLTASEQRVRPAGEWNVYEITGQADTLTLWVNGGVTSVWKGLRVPRGHVGLEAERHHIEFRNLKLKRLGK